MDVGIWGKRQKSVGKLLQFLWAQQKLSHVVGSATLNFSCCPGALSHAPAGCSGPGTSQVAYRWGRMVSDSCPLPSARGAAERCPKGGFLIKKTKQDGTKKLKHFAMLTNVKLLLGRDNCMSSPNVGVRSFPPLFHVKFFCPLFSLPTESYL